MKKILFAALAAIIVFNWSAISARIFPAKSSPLAQQGEVVLYATSWCGYCKAARELLAREGVKYTEYDIEKSSEGAKLHRALGGRGVPVIEIGDQVIRGYNEQRILAALKK